MAWSAIEWTDSTWNPVTRCDKLSPGCKQCYAQTMAKRLRAMGQPNYAKGFELTLQPQMLERPLSWNRPRVIFVNSGPTDRIPGPTGRLAGPTPGLTGPRKRPDDRLMMISPDDPPPT